ncbi:helix-turn-helix domain-containing protein [Patulibacter brassicae]|jgi:DNA-binding PucR family transcriptional regulator|uniref:Helix-turn-helix domain-containing protein n=1 Tax=Patulibacter brassicae TaxID=1705717 RepID=A0ABU4VLL1_9ACTN|nr:helix-turn-helix domain-containing protein [Patulibacter brassicae]MDX8151758.1 helix-turn-helix domain-containing protein [Patulibacter brassicae]
MPPRLRQLVTDDLTAHADDYAARVVQRVDAELPGMLAHDELAELARVGSRALLVEFRDALRVGLRERYRAPAATTAYALRLASRDVPLADVLRSYRLGQEAVVAIASRLAAEAELEDAPGELGDLIGLSFRFVDDVMRDVTATYQREREQAVRTNVARASATVRRILAGEAVDRDEAERLLAYRLDGPHVALALRSAREDGDHHAALIAEQVRDVLRPLARGRPLIAPGADGRPAAWITRDAPLDARERATLDEALRRLELGATVSEPGRGPDGFAAAHEQARRAERAVPAGRRGLVAYRDVALLVLLLADPEGARRFAAEELGPLAADGPGPAELRATLAALLACGQDRSRAALALGLHRNTVTRRLRRAEALLGHRLDERTREVEAALAIVEGRSGTGTG